MRDLHSVVRLWDVSTGEQLGPAIDDHFQGIHGLAFGALDGEEVLITGDGADRVRVRRLSTGRTAHTFDTGDVGGIELLACGELDGRPVLVSTHLDATLRVHDLATGRRRKRWRFSSRSPDDRGATALAAGRLGDVPFAAVAHAPAGGPATVRVWNLRTGTSSASPAGTRAATSARRPSPSWTAVPSWRARTTRAHYASGASARRPETVAASRTASRRFIAGVAVTPCSTIEATTVNPVTAHSSRAGTPKSACPSAYAR